jgi:hypothetical protein
MIRFLGFIFLSLICSFAIWIANKNLGGEFIGTFLGTPLLEIEATLLGLNIAGAIFLLSHLLSVVSPKHQVVFGAVKNELLDNLLLMLSLLLLSFVLLSIRPQNALVVIMQVPLNFYHIVNIGLIAAFLLTLYAVYEILKGVFRVFKIPRE